MTTITAVFVVPLTIFFELLVPVRDGNEFGPCSQNEIQYSLGVFSKFSYRHPIIFLEMYLPTGV